MKLYRITIELERDGSPDDKGYRSWDEIYHQIIDDLPVGELVVIINRPPVVCMSEKYRAMLAADHLEDKSY
jgi:hypothetical protein